MGSCCNRIADDGPSVQGARVVEASDGTREPTGFCVACALPTFTWWEEDGEPRKPWCPMHGVGLSGCVPRELAPQPDDRFASLRRELDNAYAQAAVGKGMERHGDDGRFEDQTTIRMARELGTAFPVGQAVKKLIEGERMMKTGNVTGALREWHGAMVYAAMACIVGRMPSP